MAKRKSVTSRPETAAVSHPDEMKYRARSALSTLAEAAQIRSDKPLMREVKKLHANQGKALGVKKRAAKESM